MNKIRHMSENLKSIRGILSTKNKEIIHSQLDRMINSVRIFYKSKKDFIDNFPDEDDIKGKISLIIRRRR